MKFKLDLLVCMLFALLELVSSLAIAETRVTSPGRKEILPLVLKNMPMNSERRCVGIAAVAEALLEGKVLERPEASMTLDQLATVIFENLSSNASIAYPAKITTSGKVLPITDPEVLDQLSSQVTELYKAEASWIAEQPRGAEKLQRAQALAVQSEKELRRALSADEDKTELLCCFGFREFPDGSYKETYHAVVIREFKDGSLAVFDPNDPGKPIRCQFSTHDGELVIEWKCGYRDRGFSTTQTYRVVPKSRFFRHARK